MPGASSIATCDTLVSTLTPYNADLRSPCRRSDPFDAFLLRYSEQEPGISIGGRDKSDRSPLGAFCLEFFGKPSGKERRIVDTK